VRFVNADGRAGLLVGEQVFDVATVSGGAVPADPTEAVRGHWEAMARLAARGAFDGGVPVASVRLGPPVPDPRAIFGIGLNYRSHAAETGMPLPEVTAVFAKFPSALVGPYDDIVLPAGFDAVDWEAELAFVVARGGRRIPREAALDHLAGYTCAQDVSERWVQRAAGMQFALGKSFDTFCPMGPALVSLDELADPLDLRVVCRVNGEVRQDGRTTDMVTDVAGLVAFLSSVLTLRPGDVCLTGTPAGVGMARNPPVYLQPGDVVETVIEGVGAMRNRCVADPAG
jgi:2-keto-4-pentenoate hydratase/2-oxohepta-3-ene-1,7-dioic acid hydratase in catechol pathway